MKQINLTSRFIMQHLKYCRGEYNLDKHGTMKSIENRGVRYLVKRPFGRLIAYKSKGYKEKFSQKGTLNLSKEIRELFTNMLIKNFNKIIISKPHILLEIENSIYCEISKKSKLTLKETKEITRKFIEYIFSYSSFSKEDSNEGNWCAYKFIEELNVSVCPYCNAQFTFVINKTINSTEGNFKIRPALDHIFSKSNHPLLAISVYNLVPSCDTCNSSLKGNESINLDTFLHPYIKDINSIGRFTRKLNTTDKDYYSQIVGKSMDYSIELIPRRITDQKYVNNYIKLFGINTRYDLYKPYLNNQIILRLIYNEVYLKRLEISYNKDLFNSESLKSILYENDINNSILSKVTQDLLKEIELNKIHFNSEQKSKLEELLSNSE